MSKEEKRDKERLDILTAKKKVQEAKVKHQVKADYAKDDKKKSRSRTMASLLEHGENAIGKLYKKKLKKDVEKKMKAEGTPVKKKKKKSED